MTWVKFQWHRLNPKQGFFVPCIDTEKMILLGLRSALHEGVKIEATVGICGGLLGVFFVKTG